MSERSRCCVALHNVQDNVSIKETLRLFREPICCCGKAISVTNSERVSVALFI